MTIPEKIKIDPLSQEFIDWSLKKLDDPDFYIELLREIPRKAANYYSYPKATILSELTAKLQKGAIEHGAPEYVQEEVYRELKAEYLDLIGWSLVGLWNEERRNRDAALE